MEDGCLAVLGFSAIGTTYYDVNIKHRQRLLPFILWVGQHRKELIRLAMGQPVSIELGNRAFISVKVEPYSDSCFVLNLDDNTWSESGHTPWYLDWGEVWLYSKYGTSKNSEYGTSGNSKYESLKNTIYWEALPTMDEYTRCAHVEKKICNHAVYDYGEIKAIEALLTHVQ